MGGTDVVQAFPRPADVDAVIFVRDRHRGPREAGIAIIFHGIRKFLLEPVAVGLTDAAEALKGSFDTRPASFRPTSRRDKARADFPQRAPVLDDHFITELPVPVDVGVVLMIDALVLPSAL